MRFTSPFALSLSKPVLRAHEGGRPRPTAPLFLALLSSFLRRQESRGVEASGILAITATTIQQRPPSPSSFPRKRESRAGARGGDPFPAVTRTRPLTLLPHRHSCEGRNPEGQRRGAVRPEPVEGPATTNSVRFPRSPSRLSRESGNPGQGRGAGIPSPVTRGPCSPIVIPAQAGIQRGRGEGPFALSLSKGPPPPTASVSHAPLRVFPAKAGIQGRGAGRGSLPP